MVPTLLRFDLNSIRILAHPHRTLVLADHRSGVPRFLNEVCIEPVTHDHVGNWLWKRDLEGLGARKLEADTVNGLFNDGVIVRL